MSVENVEVRRCDACGAAVLQAKRNLNKSTIGLPRGDAAIPSSVVDVDLVEVLRFATAAYDVYDPHGFSRPDMWKSLDFCHWGCLHTFSAVVAAAIAVTATFEDIRISVEKRVKAHYLAGFLEGITPKAARALIRKRQGPRVRSHLSDTTE